MTALKITSKEIECSTRYKMQLLPDISHLINVEGIFILLL